MNARLTIGQFHLDFNRSQFANEKAHIAFLKKCVGLIRGTPEYKDWSSYIKDTLGIKNCVFTNETSDEITIEIHHHPLTLFDITGVILNTYINKGDEFCSLDIIKDVLHLHYTNNIGYIPLVASLHEKYHNGFLIIPPKFVLGNWNHLIKSDEYEIEKDVLDKVKSLMDLSNNKHDHYISWQNAEVNNA